MTKTGERTCGGCGGRVLMARDAGTGRLLALEPQRTDGGWSPRADGVDVIARYTPPPPTGDRRRDGHHSHKLRCPASRAVMLPVPTPAGLRAMVGSSS